MSLFLEFEIGTVHKLRQEGQAERDEKFIVIGEKEQYCGEGGGLKVRSIFVKFLSYSTKCALSSKIECESEYVEKFC